eukprot:362220-Chlamydomonas_euryale.AAC.7
MQGREERGNHQRRVHAYMVHTGQWLSSDTAPSDAALCAHPLWPSLRADRCPGPHLDIPGIQHMWQAHLTCLPDTSGNVVVLCNGHAGRSAPSSRRQSWMRSCDSCACDVACAGQLVLHDSCA